MLITITDTEKAGWFKILTNDVYLAGMTMIKEINIAKESVKLMQVVKSNGIEYIEAHLQGLDNAVYSFTNQAQGTPYFPIESVNGVVPADLEDLKNKILALM